ncbi:hypothetical protein DSC45_23145 [Streptomyces sp. YIM 130001]|uniref:hypothetical protein n=1 Tax=Streptomyces sp. YIM 130001 TaxID=2259644 RepID=UPI000E64E289|nr:hypothetical protein [Streptomyces sp. YIM 130001]RII13855.1 hypothetical protein DSC45_23145 [Streptomyces sp. YIM 130001]
MTDRGTLARALREAGVPAGHYWIEGVHEPAPTPTDFVYLRSLPDGGWETGVYERGTHQPVAEHATQAAACGHLWTLLGPPAAE